MNTKADSACESLFIKKEKFDVLPRFSKAQEMKKEALQISTCNMCQRKNFCFVLRFLSSALEKFSADRQQAWFTQDAVFGAWGGVVTFVSLTFLLLKTASFRKESIVSTQTREQSQCQSCVL